MLGGGYLVIWFAYPLMIIGFLVWLIGLIVTLVNRK